MLEHSAVIVMAAGAGTRFKSKKSKLLHSLAGKPAIQYISAALSASKFSQSIFVLSYQKDELKRLIGEDAKFSFVEQKKLDGTAGAVKVALKEVKTHIDRVLVIPGDTPTIPLELMEKLTKSEYDISVVGTRLSDPKGFGRIKTDSNNRVISIIEENQLSEEDKSIELVNTSIYSFKRSFLEEKINEIKINKDKSEYYLTDIISIADKLGASMDCIEYDDADDVIGPNDKAHFSRLAKRIWKKRAIEHTRSGVNIIDLDSVYIDDSVVIEPDVDIYPNVFLTGKTKIESESTILEGCRIKDSEIASNSIIGPYVFIDESSVGPENRIGPFSYIRPNTKTGTKVKIGGFVETKKINVGDGSKIPHLSYIGDSEIGSAVNIGCGVITCNYDGFKKHKTIIGDNVFVGSDSQLVAPVEIEDNSYVAAGTTVTTKVPSSSLAISRTKQKNIEAYALKLKAIKSKK